MRCRRSLRNSLVVLALLAVASSALAGEGGELLCAPSRVGCITTWLVAGPLPFLRAEQFDADLLESTGGEAKARPRDGDVADAAHGITWQARVFPESVQDFQARCLPLGQSAFYLSAWLLPRQDVDCTLVVTHTGPARVWLDGDKVIVSERDPYAIGGTTARHKLSLKKGQRVHCLVKLGSEARQLQFLVRLVRGQQAVEADEVVVVLPTREAEVPTDPFVLSALRLSLGREDFVEPGKASSLFLGMVGGYPVVRGKVAATVTIKNARGRTVDTLTMEPASVPALAMQSARLSWTPPEESASPYFELTARVTLDGRKLGALTRTVYCPTNIRQWSEEIHNRLGRLAKAGQVGRESLARVLLKLEKAAILRRTRDGFAGSAHDVHRELKAASDLLDRIDQGKGLPELEPGVHELAYLADQDESAQPYFLHVPRTYTGRKALPAIVYLHGYNPYLDKTNWHMPSYGLTDLAEEYGYLIVCPFARSNTDFQGIGETDVLEVLRLAGERVKIDEDRVFLVGYSMGGMGAYTIAAHTPDRWAGVVALCARADYWFWKGLDPAKVEPWKRFLIDTEFAWPQAGNFQHVPVLAFQGTADTLIKPEQAYRFIDKLQGLGFSAQLVRLSGSSHWIGDETFATPKPFEWMEAQRRPQAPQSVRFKTYTLRYHKAWWVSLDAIDRWGQPASVQAALEPGNRLAVKTDNVARVTLRPPARHCEPAEAFQATVNGQARTLRADEGRLRLDLADLPEGKLRKTPTLCGPIKDAFNRRFLFVYGTAGGEAATKANRRAAAAMQKDWYTFAKGFRRVAKDTAVGREEMERTNLILFGTPKSNAILAEIANQLPIQFDGDSYEVLGRPFRGGPMTGLMFIYPNP
ncbi:MAG: prolyl oligopeptidase family serine peptidase, partial [Planctomycetota bacterium]